MSRVALRPGRRSSNRQEEAAPPASGGDKKRCQRFASLEITAVAASSEDAIFEVADANGRATLIAMKFRCDVFGGAPGVSPLTLGP
ncbi:MAG TPA: hypothetical protein VGG33_24295, partial [Polyangia bacterium]